MSKFIIDKDFVIVTSDKFEHQELKKGQRGFIAGHRALPISADDPYTQRIKFLLHPILKDGSVDFERLYLIDANSLKKVGTREAKNLQDKLDKLLEDVDALPN